MLLPKSFAVGSPVVTGEESDPWQAGAKKMAVTRPYSLHHDIYSQCTRASRHQYRHVRSDDKLCLNVCLYISIARSWCDFHSY